MPKPRKVKEETASYTAAPVAKPSALLDTRVIYCGDNIEQLKKPSMVREAAVEEPEPITVIGSMILQGDSLHILRRLPAQSVQCIVTSPPYWGLRDYDIVGQIGLEDSLTQYINRLVAVFNESKRVLKDDGIF